MNSQITRFYSVIVLSLAPAFLLAATLELAEEKNDSEVTQDPSGTTEQILETTSVPSFGGPSSVSSQIKADRAIQIAPFRFEGIEDKVKP